MATAQANAMELKQMPEYTMETVANGAMRVFEAVKRYQPMARVYQASSSEMFGENGEHLVSAKSNIDLSGLTNDQLKAIASIRINN